MAMGHTKYDSIRIIVPFKLSLVLVLVLIQTLTITTNVCDAKQQVVVLPVAVTRYNDGGSKNTHPYYGTATTALFGRRSNNAKDVDADLMIHTSMRGISNLFKSRRRITSAASAASVLEAAPTTACSVQTNVLSIRGGTSNTNNVPTTSTDSTTTTTDTTTPANPTTNNDDEEEEERWRDALPPQLQKRRGALHRLTLPTGLKRQQQQQQQIPHPSINDDAPVTIHPNTNTAEEEEDIYCQVYLLGTAHVSKDSCADAKLLMECIKPDVLFVELCNQRIALLEDDDDDDDDEQSSSDTTPTNDDTTPPPTKDNDTEKQSIRQMVQTALRSNPNLSKTAALSSVLLSKIQGDYASKLGVSIGGEFKEAYKVATGQQRDFEEYVRKIRWERMYGIGGGGGGGGEESRNGCTVVLGDRPVQLTLNRAYESLTLLGRIKLILGLLYSCLRQPNITELQEWIDQIMNDPNSDVLTQSIEDLSRHFPTIKETIITERDTYMTCKLLQTARVLGAATVEDGKDRVIVAIVGAGHCPGIVERIRRVQKGDEGSRVTMIEGLRDVVETKKMKVEEREDLKFLVEEVSSL